MPRASRDQSPTPDVRSDAAAARSEDDELPFDTVPRPPRKKRKSADAPSGETAPDAAAANLARIEEPEQRLGPARFRAHDHLVDREPAQQRAPGLALGAHGRVIALAHRRVAGVDLDQLPRLGVHETAHAEVRQRTLAGIVEHDRYEVMALPHRLYPAWNPRMVLPEPTPSCSENILLNSSKPRWSFTRNGMRAGLKPYAFTTSADQLVLPVGTKVLLRETSRDANVISGGHLVAKALKAEGVDTIFTLCGGHIIDIYDGCLDEGIRIVDVRHEQTAAHAAGTSAGRTTSSSPACASTRSGCSSC